MNRLRLVTPELQERERSKLASWTAALETALRDRGEDSAEIDAAVAIAVFNVAAQRWLAPRGDADLAAVTRAAFAELSTRRGA